jgi:hypothetical protein
VSPEQLADTTDRVLQARAPAVALQPRTPAAEVAPAQDVSKPAMRLKNVVLFLLAPFIGLFYILVFPIVGLVMLASLFLNAERQKPEEVEPLQPLAPARLRVVKTMAMMVVATAIGVAYAVVAPILGIGVLLWLGLQAWGKLGAKAMKA